MSLKESTQSIHHHDTNFVCGVIYEFMMIVEKTLGRKYIDAR